MGDKKYMNDILQDDQEVEEVETLSLVDFPITQDYTVSSFQDHRNPSLPPATEEFFEFFQGDSGDYSEENMMSHAEDIIFCGKLIPINEQHHRKQPQQQKQKHLRRKSQPPPLHCRRSESLSEVKTTQASQLVRNSRSLDYKKLRRNSSMCSEPEPKIQRDGSGKKFSSSRWYILLFGLVKVPPPEMDLRDIKNRQLRRSTSKSLFSPSESCDVVPVSRSDDHRKSSWRVLGFLSCKSSASVAVTAPLSYMPKV